MMEQNCTNCGNGTWRYGAAAITDACIKCRYVCKDGSYQPNSWIPKVQTNADRIRSMSDEELSGFLCSIYDDEDEYGAKVIEGVIIPCYDEYSIKEWLQKPVQECE